MLKAKLNMIGMSIVLLALPLSSYANDGFASLTNIVGKVLIEKDNSVAMGKPGMALFLDDNIIALRGASVRLEFVNGCSVSLAGNKRLSVAEAASCCGILQDAGNTRDAAACHKPRRLQSYSGGAAGDAAQATAPTTMLTVNPNLYQTLTALTGGVLVSKAGANTHNNTTLSDSNTVSSAVVTATQSGNNGGGTDTQRPLIDPPSNSSTEVSGVKAPVLPTAPPRPQVYRPQLSLVKTSDTDGGFSFLDPTPAPTPPGLFGSDDDDSGNVFIPAATSLSDC